MVLYIVIALGGKGVSGFTIRDGFDRINLFSEFVWFQYLKVKIWEIQKIISLFLIYVHLF